MERARKLEAVEYRREGRVAVGRYEQWQQCRLSRRPAASARPCGSSLQQETLTEAAVVVSPEEANRTAKVATFLLVVLAKGIPRDPSTAQVVLGTYERARRPSLFPIRADSSFDYPGAELYSEIE